MSGRANRLLSVGLVVLVCACSSPSPSASPDSSSSAGPPSAGTSSATHDAGLSPTSGVSTPPDATVGQTTVPSTPLDNEPPLGDIDLAYGAPDPVDVSVSLSPIAFTTPVTTANGGFLTLGGTDGTFYQLEIPPNAVLSDLDVTMTVVDSIGGSPLGDQLIGAVELEPSGLQLVRPATLTIMPIAPVAIEAEGPFASESDGTDFHLFPLAADPAMLSMHLTHFSVFGVFQTDADRRAAMIERTAADVQKQLEQEMAELAEEARKGEGGIDVERAQELLKYHRDRVVRPLLALAENDHTLFLKAFRTWTSWERQKHLLLGDEFYDAELLASARRAFENYVEHIKQRCYDHDLGAIRDMLSLAKENELMGGLLGELGQSEAFDFISKCATFTLEMESTMDAQLNTCMFIDAGQSNVQESATVTTAVEIRVQEPRPWSGPMQWENATYEARCRLPARQGGNLIDCEMSFAGFAEAGQFAVLGVDFDLNNINRPPPPKPPAPPGPGQSPAPSSGASPGTSPVTSPGPSAMPSPSGPPTPTPPPPPEETISEIRFRSVVVQPGDPQIFHDGDCTILGFSGGSETRLGSGAWLAGWRDNTAPTGREFIGNYMIDGQGIGEAWRLTGWEYVAEADVLAERVYEGGTNTLFGTTDEDTRFVLRHTPRR